MHRSYMTLGNKKTLKNGRPSKADQLNIQKKLRPFFERGYNGTFTSNKTGINIKTICKYFEEWSERIQESENEEFFARQKKDKERIILALDHLISQDYDLLDISKKEIENYTQENKSVPKSILNLNLETVKHIASLIERKFSILMQPPAEEELEKKINEMIVNAKSRPNY